MNRLLAAKECGAECVKSMKDTIDRYKAAKRAKETAGIILNANRKDQAAILAEHLGRHPEDRRQLQKILLGVR